MVRRLLDSLLAHLPVALVDLPLAVAHPPLAHVAFVLHTKERVILKLPLNRFCHSTDYNVADHWVYHTRLVDH